MQQKKTRPSNNMVRCAVCGCGCMRYKCTSNSILSTKRIHSTIFRPDYGLKNLRTRARDRHVCHTQFQIHKVTIYSIQTNDSRKLIIKRHVYAKIAWIWIRHACNSTANDFKWLEGWSANHTCTNLVRLIGPTHPHIHICENTARSLCSSALMETIYCVR